MAALADLCRETGQTELAAEWLAAQGGRQPAEPAPPVDLDPANIFGEVWGHPTDVAALYGVKGEPVEDGREPLSDLLRLPHLASSRPHPALRAVRRRRRKQVHTRFTAAECAAVQDAFRRAQVFFDLHMAGADARASDQFLDASAAWIEEDLYSNPHLRSDDKYRRLAPELRSDMAALHGLAVGDWFRWCKMYVLVLARAGEPDRALRTLRPFLFQSAFVREPELATELRLVQLALALAAGKPQAALAACRWFLGNHAGSYPPLLLHAAALSPADPGVADAITSPQSLRPLQRAAHHSHQPAFLLYAGHASLAKGLFMLDEATRLYTELLAYALAHGADYRSLARIRLWLATCIVQSAHKRTCLNPKLEVVRALSLVAQSYQELPPDAEPVLRAEVLYNFGRFCHLTGLVSKAEPLYRELLDMPAGAAPFVFSAAHNLHLIYLQAGNAALARAVLHRHCAV